MPADDRVASPATDAAAAMLAGLVAHGLRHLVLTPGARSQALGLVAAELERRGLIRLHVRIDERVAGFFALGIGREARVPAAVICTSGSAVANLLPAVAEAHHAGVPLILLTADRPPELQGVGANQTTRQPGMFGDYARITLEVDPPAYPDPDGNAPATLALTALAGTAFHAAAGINDVVAGPVHINVPLREPLSGDVPHWLAEHAEVVADDLVPESPAAAVLERGPRTVVVAGADAGARAEQLAHDGGWPLIAEIVSGARYGRSVVHGYRGALGQPDLGGRIERVVVWGHPTLSRELTALLSRADLEILAVAGAGEPLNLNGRTTAVRDVTVADGPVDRDWTGAWAAWSRDAAVDLSPPPPDGAALASTDAAQRLGAINTELAAIRTPVTREILVDAVWRASWPHDRVVFAASRLVRVADTVLPGKKVPVHSNRGLAGIDGTVSTALGIAAASQDDAPGVTRVIIGDLAVLHDVGALYRPESEPAPRIQVVVGNDRRGSIFDTLEVAETADPADVRRVITTPHDVDLEAIARGYGWTYDRPTTRGELDQLLTRPVAGPHLIDVPLHD